MASITTQPFAELSQLDHVPVEVQEFVFDHGLLAELQERVGLARRVFDVSAPITLSLEEDPDTAEIWIEMRVAARGNVENVMKAHETYTGRLLSLSSSSHRLIRLFLHIARD